MTIVQINTRKFYCWHRVRYSHIQYLSVFTDKTSLADKTSSVPIHTRTYLYLYSMCAGDCVHGCTVPESVRYLPTYRTVWVPNLCLYLYPLYLPVHTCISALTASICPVPVPVLMITIYVCRWLCAWLCCTCNWTCTYPPTSTYLPTYLSICTGICFFRLGDCAPDCPDPGKLVRIIQAFPVFHLLKTRKIFLFFKLRVSGLQTLSNLRSLNSLRKNLNFFRNG